MIPVTIVQLDPPWPVHTPHGEGSARFFVYRGTDSNPEFGVRCKGGIMRFYFMPDVRVYGNPMDGNGMDVDIPKEWPE